MSSGGATSTCTSYVAVGGKIRYLHKAFSAPYYFVSEHFRECWGPSSPRSSSSTKHRSPTRCRSLLPSSPIIRGTYHSTFDLLKVQRPIPVRSRTSRPAVLSVAVAVGGISPTSRHRPNFEAAPELLSHTVLHHPPMQYTYYHYRWRLVQCPPMVGSGGTQGWR